MRTALISLLALYLYASGYSQSDLRIDPNLVHLLDTRLAPFYHGVASGDPTTDAVIIWSRITLPKSITSATVEWELASDEQFTRIRKSGTITTDASRDFTLKTDVTGLEENTRYYYRFRYHNQLSPVGVTHTLGSHPDAFSIAFGSCSNYEWGYFNNYRFIAQDSSIDLVVHLGDYIYEYAPGKYGDTTLGRIHVPNREVVSLEDYRTRYSQYRLDKDLQLVHRLKPFITTWDDHEIANNGYMDGAQNHQPQEGDWYTRKNAGKQVYYEWLPVRDNAYHELYRSFRSGRLFELIILDTRIAGRTRQVDDETSPDYRDTSRSIIGSAQFDWLRSRLRDTTARWKIIGNQVPFGPLYQTNEKGLRKKYMDGWDGYPWEREKLLRIIRQDAYGRVAFVTGDYHTSFALENDSGATRETGDNASVEFIVTSISSANDDEYQTGQACSNDREQYLRFNPQMRYVNNVDHGYLVLTIRPDNLIATYYYASTVKSPDAGVRKEIQFRVPWGQPVLMGE